MENKSSLMQKVCLVFEEAAPEKELTYGTVATLIKHIKENQLSKDFIFSPVTPFYIESKTKSVIGFAYCKEAEQVCAVFEDGALAEITSESCDRCLLQAVSTLFPPFAVGIAALSEVRQATKVEYLKGYMDEHTDVDSHYFDFKSKPAPGVLVSEPLSIASINFIRQGTIKENRIPIDPLVVKDDGKEVVITELGRLNSGNAEMYAFAHNGQYFNLEPDDGSTDASIIKAVNNYCEMKQLKLKDGVKTVISLPGDTESLQRFQKLFTMYVKRAVRGRWVLVDTNIVYELVYDGDEERLYVVKMSSDNNTRTTVIFTQNDCPNSDFYRELMSSAEKSDSVGA